ncbi:MAG: Asp23/Gls24 family envelope stress response protein [Clostridiales bacterium]|nr:Asp23/Gls24 family envelope stress response protein [Clostridiales bacterium]
MAQKPQKKDNLPVKVDVDLENGGTISYANEVIATIAGVAASEIEGIAGMSVTGGISEILGRNRNITRGVKVEVGSQEAAVDLFIVVEYGHPIQKVAADVQENVRRALESLTGLHVVRVDVHVQGVSFEQEKRANQKNLEASKVSVLPPARQEKLPRESKPAVREEKPAPAEKPVKEEKPVREEKPAEPEKPAPAETPVKAEASVPAEAPAKEEKPAEAAAPADGVADVPDAEFDPETLAEEEKLDGAPEGAPKADPKPAPKPAPAHKKAPGRKRC